MKETLGVILAGGRSSRMGRDKAFVEVGGIAMIDRVASALTAAGLEIVVSGEHRPGVPFPFVPDDGGAGPLAGLVAVLAAQRDRPLFLAAVDQPLLRPDTVRGLLRLDGDAVVPLDGGVPQVTCGVYRPAIATHAVTALALPGGSLRTVLGRAKPTLIDADRWRTWGEDGRSWFSVDSPADVAYAETILAGGELRSPDD